MLPRHGEQYRVARARVALKDRVAAVRRCCEVGDLPFGRFDNDIVRAMHRHHNGARFRYSLTHELGHMVMHRFPNTEMESQADRFAAEFLMPAADIKSQLYGATLSKFAALAPYWRFH